MTPTVPTGSLRSNVDRTCRFRPIAGGGFRAAVEVTRRCNLACPHCFVPRVHLEPKLAELVGVIRKLQEVGCRKVLLTGGEPLVRSDLEDIIRATAEAGIGVDLNSNLFDLAPTRADGLVVSGLGEASVTFYGDRAFHDSFVHRAGAYESTLQSCRLLRERGVEIDIHGPLFSENLRCARHVHGLAESLGAGSLTFFKVVSPSATTGDPIVSRTRHGDSEDRFAPVTPDVVATFVQDLRRRSRIPVRTIGYWSPRNERCQQSCSIVGVTADLKMSPCLLSRRCTPQSRLLTGDTVLQTLLAMRQEVEEGLWQPVCGITSIALVAT